MTTIAPESPPPPIISSKFLTEASRSLLMKSGNLPMNDTRAKLQQILATIIFCSNSVNNLYDADKIPEPLIPSTLPPVFTQEGSIDNTRWEPTFVSVGGAHGGDVSSKKIDNKAVLRSDPRTILFIKRYSDTGRARIRDKIGAENWRDQIVYKAAYDDITFAEMEQEVLRRGSRINHFIVPVAEIRNGEASVMYFMDPGRFAEL